MCCVLSGAAWRGYSESSSEVGSSNAPHGWTHGWAESPARYQRRLQCCSRTLAASLSLTENLDYLDIFMSADWPHTAVPMREPDVNCLWTVCGCLFVILSWCWSLAVLCQLCGSVPNGQGDLSVCICTQTDLCTPKKSLQNWDFSLRIYSVVTWAGTFMSAFRFKENVGWTLFLM